MEPSWEVPCALVQILGMPCAVAFLYVFPDGRFVPRWAGILLIVWAVWAAVWALAPGSLLAGLYTASVAFSQRVFVALTGEKSDGAIVITTLVVASAFTPVKGSLQSIVEERASSSPRSTSNDLLRLLT